MFYQVAANNIEKRTKLSYLSTVNYCFYLIVLIDRDVAGFSPQIRATKDASDVGLDLIAVSIIKANRLSESSINLFRRGRRRHGGCITWLGLSIEVWGTPYIVPPSKKPLCNVVGQPSIYRVKQQLRAWGTQKIEVI